MTGRWPLTWASTPSADGAHDLAPHSFFTIFFTIVESEPSLRGKPLRVADSPVALECEVHSTLGAGDSPVVFGQVVHAVVSRQAGE